MVMRKFNFLSYPLVPETLLNLLAMVVIDRKLCCMQTLIVQDEKKNSLASLSSNRQSPEIKFNQ